MEGESSKTYFFGNDGNSLMPLLVSLFNQKGIDPSILYAMNNNGGFGNGGFFWVIFLFFLMGWGGNGWGNGGFGANGGTGFLANQLSNDAGRDLLLQAIQGNGNAIGQLATNLNTSITAVQTAVNGVLSAVQSTSAQVGLTGQQTINAIQLGDAAISRQLCECCCENRLLTTQQGYEAQLRTVEQTNQLGSQADRNATTILSAIKDQNAMIVDQFCQVKERELQSKIDGLLADNTALRTALSEGRQTQQFTAAFNTLDNKITELAAKQPSTVPVQWPNLTAVNNTPYGGGYGYGFNPWGYGWGGQSYWG